MEPAFGHINQTYAVASAPTVTGHAVFHEKIHFIFEIMAGKFNYKFIYYNYLATIGIRRLEKLEENQRQKISLHVTW